MAYCMFSLCVLKYAVLVTALGMMVPDWGMCVVCAMLGNLGFETMGMEGGDVVRAAIVECLGVVFWRTKGRVQFVLYMVLGAIWAFIARTSGEALSAWLDRDSLSTQGSYMFGQLIAFFFVYLVFSVLPSYIPTRRDVIWWLMRKALFSWPVRKFWLTLNAGNVPYGYFSFGAAAWVIFTSSVGRDVVSEMCELLEGEEVEVLEKTAGITGDSVKLDTIRNVPMIVEQIVVEESALVIFDACTTALVGPINVPSKDSVVPEVPTVVGSNAPTTNSSDPTKLTTETAVLGGALDVNESVGEMETGVVTPLDPTNETDEEKDEQAVEEIEEPAGDSRASVSLDDPETALVEEVVAVCAQEIDTTSSESHSSSNAPSNDVAVNTDIVLGEDLVLVESKDAGGLVEEEEQVETEDAGVEECKTEGLEEVTGSGMDCETGIFAQNTEDEIPVSQSTDASVDPSSSERQDLPLSESEVLLAGVSSDAGGDSGDVAQAIGAELEEDGAEERLVEMEDIKEEKFKEHEHPGKTNAIPETAEQSATHASTSGTSAVTELGNIKAIPESAGNKDGEVDENSEGEEEYEEYEAEAERQAAKAAPAVGPAALSNDFVVEPRSPLEIVEDEVLASGLDKVEVGEDEASGADAHPQDASQGPAIPPWSAAQSEPDTTSTLGRYAPEYRHPDTAYIHPYRRSSKKASRKRQGNRKSTTRDASSAGDGLVATGEAGVQPPSHGAEPATDESVGNNGSQELAVHALEPAVEKEEGGMGGNEVFSQEEGATANVDEGQVVQLEPAQEVPNQGMPVVEPPVEQPGPAADPMDGVLAANIPELPHPEETDTNNVVDEVQPNPGPPVSHSTPAPFLLPSRPMANYLAERAGRALSNLHRAPLPPISGIPSAWPRPSAFCFVPSIVKIEETSSREYYERMGDRRRLRKACRTMFPGYERLWFIPKPVIPPIPSAWPAMMDWAPSHVEC